MGLDTSHGCWHGAYSAFTRFRDELAKAAGYKFKKTMHGTLREIEVPDIDWDSYPLRAYQGDWSDLPTPKDPLLFLIVHSDCDGVLMPEQAKPLADRLQELLPKLPDGSGGGHIWDWREVTQRFIDGLRVAVAAGESVDFH